MEKVAFRDILAVIFIILDVGILITGFTLLCTQNVSELAASVIGGTMGTFGTLLTLIIQFYFRKKPEEK